MQGEDIHVDVKFSVANPYRICIQIFFFKMKLHIKHRQPSISGFFFYYLVWGGGAISNICNFIYLELKNNNSAKVLNII